MRLAVGFVFQPKWTMQIHEEWMRNVLKNRPDLTIQQLERTRVLMDQWGRDWHVYGYESLVTTLELPDVDDRHVLAAAIASKTPIIVTFNLSDFPEVAISPHGIRALHPDSFLLELLQSSREPFISAVKSHRTALKNPPRTPEEYLNQLTENGLHATSKALTPIVDQI